MSMIVRSIVIFVVLMLVCIGDALGDTVRLRTSVAAERGGPVTLGMLAQLDGERAEGLRGLVVLERAEPETAGEAWIELDLERVRSAVREAGVGEALLAFSGDTCLVRLRGVRAQPVARGGGANEEPDAKPEIVDLGGSATVRTRFASLLAEIYGVEARDLRLKFATTDEELLSMSEHGRRVIVRPTSSRSSARASAEVRVLSGERTIASGTVSAEVEVRRRVLVAGGDVDRGDTLRGSMVREVEMWVTPGGGEATRLEQAVGMTMQTKLREGDVVRAGDLESPVVVQRGDLVDVIALNGGVSVQVKARARSEGRVGERIELRLEGSRRSFVARVDGPGRAVIVLDSGTGVAGGG